MTPRLTGYLKRTSRLVEKSMHRWLPAASAAPAVIHKSMRYSIDAGGKRLRPVLVIAAAEACGGTASQVLPTACALEFIHTYSLIHDDLPAMDDDDLRRGRPTNHKVYGDAIAILAGDALLTLAFRLIADNANIRGVTPENALKTSAIVADGAGTFGMVGGQVADIVSEDGQWRKKGRLFPQPKRILEFIHLNKTAALIRASLVAGATLVGGSKRQIAALDSYGRSIGLAFQVADDILDRVGDKKKLGKRGSDKDNDKLTYPALFGLDPSVKIGQRMIADAHRALKPFGNRVGVLHDLADYVIQRDR